MADTALSNWRADSAAWLSRYRSDLLILAGIWLASSLGYFLLARGYVTPRHQQDEFLYWALGKSFAAGDGFSWREVPVALRPFLYPVSISPAFHLAGTVQGQFNAVHAINSLMMCATAFPAFLMARLFTDRSGAYIATAFALLVPAMNYVGLVGTEPLAYPVCTAALGAILLACAKPRARNTILALALIVLAVVSRLQFVILLPVFFAAIFAIAMMRGREGWREYLGQQKLALGLLGLGFAAGALLLLVDRYGTVGLYGGLFAASPLTSGNAAFWAKSFAADVFLVVAVVPAIATFALIARRANRRDPLLGALIAVAFLTTFVLIAQVVWFSATSPEYWRTLNLFYERYIFYLGPLFFTGFMAARGKVSTRAAAITSVIAVVVISGFQAEALATPFSYEAFGLTFLSHYVTTQDGSFTQVGLIAAGVGAVLALVYVLSTISDRHPNVKRYATALAIGLPMALLVMTQARAWTYGIQYASDSRNLQPQPIDFVARATDEDVGMVVASGNSRIEYFQDEFWNPNITQFYVSAAPPVSSPEMFTPFCPFSWDRTGTITSKDCPDLPDHWYLRGKTLTMHLRGETMRVKAGPTATLMAAPQPIQISSFLAGRDPLTGKLTPEASITTFLGQPGRVRYTLTSADGRLRRINLPVKAAEQTIKLRVASGENVRMTDAEVREGNGPWRPLS